MPIYEYRCEQCGHELEKLQRMGDDPLRDCPACEQPQLRRLISAAGFRLKGSGWYETDFKDQGKRNLAEADAAKPAADGDSGAAKEPGKAGDAPAAGKEAKADKAPAAKPSSAADSSKSA